MTTAHAAPVPTDPNEALARAQDGIGYWGRVWERLRADKITLLVSALLLAIVLMAIFAPWLATHDPTQGSILGRLKGFGYKGHLLGTDETGRDLLSRLLFGARLSLVAGVLPVVFALVIGGLLGIVAGYFRGWVNTLIMRGMDVLYAFPSILLAIAICGILGSGLENTILALTITFIPPIVRISETVTAQVRTLDFVDAARIHSLRTGVPSSSTVQRLRQASQKLGIAADETSAVIEGFNFIQLLRLRSQHLDTEHDAPGDNRVNPDRLNELDRRILKEAFRQARKVQTRLKLDYQL